MTLRKLVAALCALALVGVAAQVAFAASAPKRATVRVASKDAVKVNRYLQVGLRWNHDTYTVRSGGTLHIVNSVGGGEPHSFTAVSKKDLPRSLKQINSCKICEKLGAAHGADPNSDAPPKFPFLENGTGQATPPSFDRPGDSALIDSKKNSTLDLKVTAARGTNLHILCFIHPWMQATVRVR